MGAVEQGRLVVWQPLRRTRLSCLSGRIWLTRDGCLYDSVLKAGDQVVIGRGDKVLLEALGGRGAQLRLSSVPGWLHGIRQRLASILRAGAEMLEGRALAQ